MNEYFGHWCWAGLERLRRCARILGRSFALSGLICASLSGTVAWSQSASSAPSAPPSDKAAKGPLSNRWLIIVETSKRMRPRGPGIQQTIPALVFSAMNGQMWRGDTLGMWTFNEELHAGQFPLQEWTPGNSQAIALQVSDFLGAQKYEKDSYLEKIVPLMQRVIHSSDYITVLLVSDGRKKIQGTPFDDKINTFYDTWGKQQEKAQMPFITVFRAEHGQITNYAVTASPYPLELPPLPPELTKRMVEPAPAQVAAPRAVPPLIVHGKKPEPEPAVAPAAAVTTNAAPVVAAVTNEAPVRPPEPAANGTTEKPAPSTTVAAVSTVTNPAPVMPAMTATASNSPPQPSEVAHSSGPAAASESSEAVPDKFWKNPKIMWTAAVGGVVVAFWLGWMMGRSREPFRVSLLSRPSDRD